MVGRLVVVKVREIVAQGNESCVLVRIGTKKRVCSVSQTREPACTRPAVLEHPFRKGSVWAACGRCQLFLLVRMAVCVLSSNSRRKGYLFDARGQGERFPSQFFAGRQSENKQNTCFFREAKPDQIGRIGGLLRVEIETSSRSKATLRAAPFCSDYLCSSTSLSRGAPPKNPSPKTPELSIADPHFYSHRACVRACVR